MKRSPRKHTRASSSQAGAGSGDPHDEDEKPGFGSSSELRSHTEIGDDLVELAREGRRAEVGEVLQRGVNVDYQNAKGYSALIAAASKKRTETVKLLLSFRADPNLRTGLRLTALLEAARVGRPDICAMLLDAGAEVDATQVLGWSALHEACRNGHEEVVKLLLSRDANPALRDEEGLTPLDQVHESERLIRLYLTNAIRSRNLPMPAPRATSHQISAAASSSGSSDTSLIYRAVLARDEALALSLISRAKSGAIAESCINYVEPLSGYTPLILAPRTGKVSIVRALLAAGADPAVASKNRWTLAIEIARIGNVEMLDALVAHLDGSAASKQDRARLLNATNKMGWHPLIEACRNRRSALVLRLLQEGADVGHVDEEGNDARAHNADPWVELLLLDCLEHVRSAGTRAAGPLGPVTRLFVELQDPSAREADIRGRLAEAVDQAMEDSKGSPVRLLNVLVVAASSFNLNLLRAATGHPAFQVLRRLFQSVASSSVLDGALENASEAQLAIVNVVHLFLEMPTPDHFKVEEVGPRFAALLWTLLGALALTDEQGDHIRALVDRMIQAPPTGTERAGVPAALSHPDIGRLLAIREDGFRRTPLLVAASNYALTLENYLASAKLDDPLLTEGTAPDERGVTYCLPKDVLMMRARVVEVARLMTQNTVSTVLEADDTDSTVYHVLARPCSRLEVSSLALAETLDYFSSFLSFSIKSGVPRGAMRVVLNSKDEDTLTPLGYIVRSGTCPQQLDVILELIRLGSRSCDHGNELTMSFHSRLLVVLRGAMRDPVRAHRIQRHIVANNDVDLLANLHDREGVPIFLVQPKAVVTGQQQQPGSVGGGDAATAQPDIPKALPPASLTFEPGQVRFFRECLLHMAIYVGSKAMFDLLLKISQSASGRTTHEGLVYNFPWSRADDTAARWENSAGQNAFIMCARAPAYRSADRDNDLLGIFHQLLLLDPMNQLITRPDAYGWCAIHYASFFNRTALILRLTDEHVDMTVRTAARERGGSSLRTALHLASLMGHVPTIRALLSNKVEVEAIDRNGYTSLACAMKNRQICSAWQDGNIGGAAEAVVRGLTRKLPFRREFVELNRHATTTAIVRVSSRSAASHEWEAMPVGVLPSPPSQGDAEQAYGSLDYTRSSLLDRFGVLVPGRAAKAFRVANNSARRTSWFGGGGNYGDDQDRTDTNTSFGSSGDAEAPEPVRLERLRGPGSSADALIGSGHSGELLAGEQSLLSVVLVDGGPTLTSFVSARDDGGLAGQVLVVDNTQTTLRVRAYFRSEEDLALDRRREREALLALTADPTDDQAARVPHVAVEMAGENIGVQEVPHSCWSEPLPLMEGRNVVRVVTTEDDRTKAVPETFEFVVVRSPPRRAVQVAETYELTVSSLLSAGASISAAVTQSGEAIHNLVNVSQRWGELTQEVEALEAEQRANSERWAKHVASLSFTDRNKYRSRQREWVSKDSVHEARLHDLYRSAESQELIRYKYEKLQRPVKIVKLLRALIYVLVITVVAVYRSSNWTRDAFYMYRALEAQLANDQFKPVVASAHDTAETYAGTDFNIDDLWDWTQGPLLDALYGAPGSGPLQYWDAGENGALVPVQNTVARYSQLLGVPRFRQVRSKRVGCDMSDTFASVTADCFTSSPGEMEHEVFDPRPRPANRTAGYPYLSESETGAVQVWGRTGIFNGGGFVQELPRPGNDTAAARAVASALLDDMRAARWMDAKTRAVFVEWSLVNGNANLLMSCAMQLEFPLAGGIFTSTNFVVVKLTRPQNTADKAYGILYAILLGSYAFHIYTEASELRRQKWSYWSSFANVIDMFIIASLATVFALQGVIWDMEGGVELVSDHYVRIQRLARVYYAQNVIFSLVVLAAFFKLSDYFGFFRQLGVLTIVVRLMVRRLMNWVFLFCLSIAAFTSAEMVAYGYTDERSQSWIYAFVNRLLGVISGNPIVQDHQYEQRILGTFYNILFILLCSILFLNLLIAILTSSFDEATELGSAEQARRLMDELAAEGLLNVPTDDEDETPTPSNQVFSFRGFNYLFFLLFETVEMAASFLRVKSGWKRIFCCAKDVPRKRKFE